MREGIPEPQREMYDSEDSVVCADCLTELRGRRPSVDCHEISLDLPGESRCCYVCGYERVVKWRDLDAPETMIVEVLEAMRRQIMEYMVVSREMIDSYVKDNRPPGERADLREKGAAAEQRAGTAPSKPSVGG